MGYPSFIPGALKNRLEQLGIVFSRQMDKDATHVVLGAGKIKISTEVKSKNVTFLSEKQLSRELWRLEKAHLLTEKDEEKLDAVKALITSENEVNVQLGIQLLIGGGLPKKLVPYVFIAWVIRRKRNYDERQSIFKLLYLNVEDDWKFVLDKYEKKKFRKTLMNFDKIRNKVSLYERDYEADIKKFLQKNKFDIAEIKKALSI